MVNLDIDLKALIGLAEINSIDKEKLKGLLEKFEKKDFIEYLINTTYTPEENQEEPDF